MGAKLAALPLAYVVLLAFWTVLAAELVGDKAIYTVASLALRFPRGLVFGAMTAAFAGKMFAAVLLGKLLVGIPSHWTAMLSAVAFFASAVFIWFKEPESAAHGPGKRGSTARAVAVCFAALFLTEWGDPGQITAAALTVQAQAWWAVWLGGTLALMTKGGLALTVGQKLCARLPQQTLRILASASCCVLGIIALSGIGFR
jgi:putative Ca2+/H+ antiporter (TMEM165/GDT1 family)